MSERITVSITSDLRAMLEDTATKTELSVSDIVRRCIHRSLTTIEKQFTVEEIADKMLKEAQA